MLQEFYCVHIKKINAMLIVESVMSNLVIATKYEIGSVENLFFLFCRNSSNRIQMH